LARDLSVLPPARTFLSDRKSAIFHNGGIVSSAGVYLMGAPFMRRRKSTLIDGAADDARDLSDHLASYLHGRKLPASDSTPLNQILDSTRRQVAELR